MKKRISLFLLLFAAFLIGCTPTQDSTLESAKSKLLTLLPSEATTKVELPTTLEGFNCEITWESKNVEIIDNSGICYQTKLDQEATLEFTIRIHDNSIKGSVTIKVLALPTTVEDAFNEIANLSFGEVTADITLPTTHTSGATIIWVSSNEEVLSSSGKVNALPNDTIVTLQFIVSLNNETKSGSIDVTVKGVKPPVDDDKISTWIKASLPAETMFDPYLPEYYAEENIRIKWTYNGEAISNKASFIPTVTEKTDITLNYSSDNLNGEVVVSILPLDEALANKFNAVEAYLSEAVLPSAIGDITLPNAYKDASITWSTNCESAITNTGEFLVEIDDFYTVDLIAMITIDGLQKNYSIEIEACGVTPEDIFSEYFSEFPKVVINNVPTEIDHYYPGFIITWRSSNQDILADDGAYNKPMFDTILDIYVDIKIYDQVYTYTGTTRVYGIPLNEKNAEIEAWLLNDILDDTVLTEYDELSLPTEYEKYEATITWKSSNSNVIDENGNIIHYPFDRYVDMDAIIDIRGDQTIVNVSLLILAKNNMSKEEQIEAFINAIALTELPRVDFKLYYDITQSYNHLAFYDGTPLTIVEELVAEGNYNRPGIKLYSVEFITVHDTANNSKGATAKMHSSYVRNPDTTTSWHYSLDENGAYHQIPDDEVAFHAGDGKRAYELTNSNVKATKRRPVITITEDGYYAFNGEKSVILAPTIDGKIATTDKITPSGIYTTIIDGYYYMNASYYNSDFKLISNQGGNRNSIGIETCVDAGSDYMKTVHNNAKLVAKLCIENNLTLDRILQHNNFSGKACPNQIRTTDYWDEFLDLVSLYKYASLNMSDVEFVWTSQSDILTADGKISKNIGSATEVNYSVAVTYNGTTKNYSFTTKLVG